jgi:hypothetical protein
MVAQSPIYSAKDRNLKIGYVEEGAAFDLSGNRRCNYSASTGNLIEFDSGQVIGHVSLAGYFVGLSWIANQLFPTPDATVAPEAAAAEAIATNSTDTPLPTEAERALEMVQITLATKPFAAEFQVSGHLAHASSIGEESDSQSFGNAAPTSSPNLPTLVEPIALPLSGDVEHDCQTVRSVLARRMAETRRDTADNVAARMREHLTELRKQRPRIRNGFPR